MSRRCKSVERKIISDIKYGSIQLSKFINSIVKCGKKSLAERIVYDAFAILEKKHKVDPFETFNTAIKSVCPLLEVVPVRVGGSNYQVPSPVREKRGKTLAIRWIIKAAKKRSEKTMILKLAEELFEASNGRGGSVKTKDDMHKMAEANNAFAHFSVRRTRNG